MRISGGDSAWRPLQVNERQRISEAVDAQAPSSLPAPDESGGPERSTIDGPGFAEMLRGALERVNAVQQNADLAMERVATGDAEDLHEAIIAVEKADIALRLTAQVTQRAVEAYKEISRMQV